MSHDETLPYSYNSVNMTDPTTITLVINAIITPLLVLFTLWVKKNVSKEERDEKRHDKQVDSFEERIRHLEKEIREVRIELKNRDAEYLELYKEHTTLKAKYEVLEADHEDLKKKYEATVAELSKLGSTCKEDHMKL